MSDENEKLSRREFLWRASVIGAAAAGGAGFLSSCKKGGGGGGAEKEKKSESEPKEEPESKPKEKEGGGSEKTAQKGGDLDCTDTSGLKDSEIKTRESLKYVDKSTKPDKTCANCNLYEAPDSEGSCGGCSVVPGPINPAGYCNSWVKKSG